MTKPPITKRRAAEDRSRARSGKLSTERSQKARTNKERLITQRHCDHCTYRWRQVVWTRKAMYLLCNRHYVTRGLLP